MLRRLCWRSADGQGTCKLLDLVIADLVDEDTVRHGRRHALAALIFGTAALLAKPGQVSLPASLPSALSHPTLSHLTLRPSRPC